MAMLWLWTTVVTAVLIVCAAEPDRMTKALSTLLSALGAWPLWAVTQVRDHALRAVVRMLDHRAHVAAEPTPLPAAQQRSQLGSQRVAGQGEERRGHALGDVPGDGPGDEPSYDVIHDPLLAYAAERAADVVTATATAKWAGITTDTAGFMGTPMGERAEDLLLELGSWIGTTLLARLINLLLALALLLGLLSLDFLRASLVTLGIVAVVPLVPPAAAMGMLFATLPLLFGALLLESLNLLPPNARLFSRLEANPSAKRLFDWAARGGAALTLCLEVCVFVDSWLMLQHQHSLLLEGLLTAITGVLVVLAGVPAFWSVILGVTAVVALALVVVWLLAAGLTLVLRGVNLLTTLLAEHVAPRLVRTLALPGTVARRLLARLPGVRALMREAPAELEDGGSGGLGSGQAFVEMRPGAALPAPVSLAHRTSFVFVDEHGRRLMDPLLLSVGLQGGKGSVDAAGYCGLTQPPGRSAQRLIRRLGGQDTSLDPREIARALELAQTPEETEATLLRLSCEKLVAHLPPKGVTDPVVVALDLAQVPHIAPALQTLHARLPRQPVVLVVDTPLEAARTSSPSSPMSAPLTPPSTPPPQQGTVLDAPDALQAPDALDALNALDATTRARLLLLRRFWQEGLILGSLLYDGHGSPLEQDVGQLRQLEPVSVTLAGLFLAHKHAAQNATTIGALAPLCHESPFLSLTVGSAAVPPGPLLARLDPGRWVTRRAPVGRGDLEATRTRLQDLLTRLRREGRYRTLAVPDGARWGRALAICTYPFHPQDERFQAIAETLERALGTALPGSRSLMISGNGCRDSGMGDRYFGQIGLLQGWDLPEAALCPAGGEESDRETEGVAGVAGVAGAGIEEAFRPANKQANGAAGAADVPAVLRSLVVPRGLGSDSPGESPSGSNSATHHDASHDASSPPSATTHTLSPSRAHRTPDAPNVLQTIPQPPTPQRDLGLPRALPASGLDSRADGGRADDAGKKGDGQVPQVSIGRHRGRPAGPRDSAARQPTQSTKSARPSRRPVASRTHPGHPSQDPPTTSITSTTMPAPDESGDATR